MKLSFNVTFMFGTKKVAEIKGRAIDGELSVQEISEKVNETEQFLERLTGHQVHISVEQITKS